MKNNIYIRGRKLHKKELINNIKPEKDYGFINTFILISIIIIAAVFSTLFIILIVYT